MKEKFGNPILVTHCKEIVILVIDQYIMILKQVIFNLYMIMEKLVWKI